MCWPWLALWQQTGIYKYIDQITAPSVLPRHCFRPAWSRITAGPQETTLDFKEFPGEVLRFNQVLRTSVPWRDLAGCPQQLGGCPHSRKVDIYNQIGVLQNLFFKFQTVGIWLTVFFTLLQWFQAISRLQKFWQNMEETEKIWIHNIDGLVQIAKLQ